MMAVLRTRELTFLRPGGHFAVPARTVSVVVVCTGVCFAGAHLTQAQEATSANLPDQFQTGEMIQIRKPKKKKAEATSQIAATAPKQDTAPVPEQPLAAEEVPTQNAPPEEKKTEPNRSTASMPPNQKPATPTRTGASCGRAGSNRRACRKETSIEKTAATCCATGGGEHFGARSGVAFGGTIHGNHRAFA